MKGVVTAIQDVDHWHLHVHLETSMKVPCGLVKCE